MFFKQHSTNLKVRGVSLKVSFIVCVFHPFVPVYEACFSNFSLYINSRHIISALLLPLNLAYISEKKNVNSY